MKNNASKRKSKSSVCIFEFYFTDFRLRILCHFSCVLSALHDIRRKTNANTFYIHSSICRVCVDVQLLQNDPNTQQTNKTKIYTDSS